MTDKLDGEDALFGVTSSEYEAVVPPRPVPRRPRDLSPVAVRYGAPQVT
jgi:hypothetical protein